MAIDRETTLRRAEKLRRQGRLEAAIAEYEQVVADQPRDWNTVNLLGDLYVRAGQIESAVRQYTRVAEHFAREGFFQKASALYRKIVKIRPDDEHALLQSADLSEQQGLYADAKANLGAIADRRLRRGDHRGAAEIALRVARLDPADVGAGLQAARAAADLGDLAGAALRLKAAAAELMRRGRPVEGLAALSEAAALDPDDNELRAALLRASLDAGQIERARQYASASADFRAIASALVSQGREREALEALSDALRLEPGDADTHLQLARTYLASGDLDQARRVMSAIPAGAKSCDAQLVRAELELRSGQQARGREMLAGVLTEDAGAREAIVSLGLGLGRLKPDAGFPCIDLVADHAVAADDWRTAASALRAFLSCAPEHVPALMRLVEVCVDGGLEATMHAAQAQLADAYLAAGRSAEALVIAEDLVAREPWQPANIERLRQALLLQGELDADRVIADHLSGDGPFLGAELAAEADDEADDPEGDETALWSGRCAAGEQADEDGAAQAVGSEHAPGTETALGTGEVDITVDLIETVFQTEPPPDSAPTASVPALAPALISDVEPEVDSPPGAESSPEAAGESEYVAALPPAAQLIDEVAFEQPLEIDAEPGPSAGAHALQEPELPSTLDVETEPTMGVPFELEPPPEYPPAADLPDPAGEPPIDLRADRPPEDVQPSLDLMSAFEPVVESAFDTPSESRVELTSDLPRPPDPEAVGDDVLESPDAEPETAPEPQVFAALDTSEELASELLRQSYGEMIEEPYLGRAAVSLGETAEAPVEEGALEAAAVLAVEPGPDTSLEEVLPGPTGGTDGGEDLPPEPAIELVVVPPVDETVDDIFDLSVGTLDLSALLEAEPAGPQVSASREPVVQAAGRELGDGASGEREAGGICSAVEADASPTADGRVYDLEPVFELFRDQAASVGHAETAARHLKLALAYRAMGMISESIKSLEAAAKSPRWRFEAASGLAHTYKAQGRIDEAVEWYERAAETPAPSADSGRRLLYDLGRTLNEAGEADRALAVFLELQADAPEYRDVAAWVRRLSSTS